jgi:signal transduction histidine kinase/CHASE1-domain containing sensor protein/ActR/RegA family two-component response regulator
MSTSTKTKTKGWQGGAPLLVPGLVLALSLVATGAAAWYIDHLAEARDRVRFENAIQSAHDRISSRLDIYVNLLRGGAAMIGARDEELIESIEEFSSYVVRLNVAQEYPGIQGVGLSARIGDQEALAGFEQRMRSIHPEFNVWPDDPRQEYHSIIHLEPLDRRNQAAIGFDMYSHPTRREAMAAARDSGRPHASGRVTLVQEIDQRKQAGFLVYFPLYAGGSVPPTVEERRERLVGYVYSPFRADDLFINIFGTERRPRVDFAVFDGSGVGPETLIHDSGLTNEDNEPRRTASRRFAAAGREWTIVYQARPEFVWNSARRLLLPTLLGGVLLSFILFGIALMQHRARMEAEEVALRLSEREKELRSQGEVLATLNRIGRTLSGELELERLVEAVTDAATTLTGAQFGIFVYEAVRAGEARTGHYVTGPLQDAFSTIPSERMIELLDSGTGGESIRLDRARSEPPSMKLPLLDLPAAPAVESYLFVPVVSRSGTALGALIFGHEQPAVFGDREEMLVAGLAAQAAVAMDNAHLYEEAQLASRAKDEFLATLSHELRTPMTSILGWSRLLSLGASDESTVRAAVEAIHRSAQTQAQLIEDVLDISRVIRGKLRLKIAPTDPNEVVAAAVETVRHAAETKGVDLEVRLSPEPLLFPADASRLQQVVWNLLNNGIKFTPRGGKVSVEVERGATAVSISVTDTGQGIPQGFLPRLFEKFQQADSSSTRSHGGLGLGLAIVRYIVELHGGSVIASSEGAGRGSTFLVELPISSRVPADGRASPAPGPGSITAAELPVLDGVRILVVDDDAATRAVVTAVMRRCGAAATSVDSASEARKALDEDRFDLIISDIAMPGEDGHSLIRDIRSDRRFETIPAIALSAHGQQRDHELSLEAGFDRHVNKPVDPIRLAEIVATLLEKKSEVSL